MTEQRLCFCCYDTIKLLGAAGHVQNRRRVQRECITFAKIHISRQFYASLGCPVHIGICQRTSAKMKITWVIVCDAQRWYAQYRACVCMISLFRLRNDQDLYRRKRPQSFALSCDRRSSVLKRCVYFRICKRPHAENKRSHSAVRTTNCLSVCMCALRSRMAFSHV